MKILIVDAGAVAGLAVLLAGCAGVESATVPNERTREVAVACIPASQTLQKPARRSGDELMAMPEGPRTLAAWSELEKLWAYVPQLEALVDGCGRLPATGPP